MKTLTLLLFVSLLGASLTLPMEKKSNPHAGEQQELVKPVRREVNKTPRIVLEEIIRAMNKNLTSQKIRFVTWHKTA